MTHVTVDEKNCGSDKVAVFVKRLELKGIWNEGDLMDCIGMMYGNDEERKLNGLCTWK